MGYSGQIMTDLAVSALLHDIGKRDISKELLHKSGNLTDEEFVIIKSHPDHGAELITDIYPWIPDRIVRGILEHHERMDGSGYPLGLSWYDISDFARIIAVADVYEACKQMWGEMGEHQVKIKNPKTAMLRGYGGAQNVAAIILQKKD